MPTNDNQNLIDKMICKAPENVIATTELSTTTTELSTTTRKPSKKIIILVGIVGGGSLFPCLLLACCLYALCRQNNEQDDNDDITMKSISSNEVASMEIQNECLLTESANYSTRLGDFYPQCLQCRIQTLIKSDDIQLETDSLCSTVELQCVQLIFDGQDLFDDFFNLHQEYIYDLFSKTNADFNQNTLHVTLKMHQFKEVNRQYIERHFQSKYQAYRVLFLEVYLQDSVMKIHEDLIGLTRLSMKIILNCRIKNELLQTIYTIHNQKISLESQKDHCSLMSPTTNILMNPTSSPQFLLISEEKPKTSHLFPILFTCMLISLLILSLFYYYKRDDKKSSKISNSGSASTISLETPVSIEEKARLSLKPKRTKVGMRVVQLFNEEI
ncbi:unnamed protein product [Adineta ricciae]|uniref:Uncharacterized protein n=1 Tax=Adineta ricciae TaxID=249248 RepID=A0A814H7P9_ADIRI|nr:unnamed protein product [Adineta ricciae]